MGVNRVQKILSNHLVSGQIVLGEAISISVDQTLLHDVSGTMAALEFESLSMPRIKTKLSLMYIDHNRIR
jgi:aconitate hydratase